MPARFFSRFALLACLVSLGILSRELILAQDPAAVEKDGGAARGSVVEDRAARKLLEAGDARFEADEFTKAVEVWQSVIERYPRSKVRFDGHMRLGKFLLERDRAYDRARAHFEACAAEENSSEEQRADATLQMGVCFYEARNFGKCFSVMREVIEKFPVSPQVNSAYYYIGLAHFQQGHYSRAIQALERVGTSLSAEEGKVEKVEAGKRLFIKIEDADLAVLESGQSINLTVTSGLGDEEIVEAFPIGRNVRVVLGSIITSLGRVKKGDKVLEVRGNDKITVRYTDSHTADKQFDRPILKEVAVVGGGVVEVTDGAFSESLHGVILGKSINLQISDPDLDLTDGADQLKAVIEVFREKSQEEVDAETAKAVAGQDPKAPVKPVDDPEEKKTEEEQEAARFKLVDRMEVTLIEAKVLREAAAKAEADENLEEATIEAEKLEAEKKKQAESAKSDDKGGTGKPRGDEAKPAKKSATDSAGTEQTAAAKTGSAKADGEKSSAKTPAKPDAKGESKAPAAPAVQEPPDDSIHSGVFRLGVPLVKSEEPIAGDDTLQAITGDVIQISYVDELNITDAPRLIKLRVKSIEGNIGEVRVTRSVIGDQELRIQTQLKTASALTNIANRYKEFGLKKNADSKYAQALGVCEEISDDAQRLGGRLLEEMYVQLWHIYFEMDRLELAAAMCQRLQNEFPQSGFVDDALLQLADVVRKQGDLQRAIGIYLKLVEMKTSQLRGEAQFGVAECYSAMAKQQMGAPAEQLRDRAFQEYKKVFDNFPESGRVGEAVAQMANYYFQQKDYSRAIDVFESVLNEHPDAKFLDVILFNYGRCLVRMNKMPDARKQFDQLISEFPESPLAVDAKKISEELSKRGF